MAYDYHHVGLSLKVHPMGLRREELARRGVVAASRLAELRAGRRVEVAGLVTVRQRPSTAKGIVFMTLEDETGVANLLVRPEVYERYRKVARSATGMLAAGRLERSDGVIHVVVDRMVDRVISVETVAAIACSLPRYGTHCSVGLRLRHDGEARPNSSGGRTCWGTSRSIGYGL